jgi:hypothetical protein
VDPIDVARYDFLAPPGMGGVPLRGGRSLTVIRFL